MAKLKPPRLAIYFLVFALFVLFIVALLASISRRHIADASVTRTSVVYADNNASTPMFPMALIVLTETSRTCFANPSAVHGLGQSTREILETRRLAMAKMLGISSSSNLYFTGCATESNNIAIRGFIAAASGTVRLIVLPTEHASVRTTIESCANTHPGGRNSAAISVVHARVDDTGKIQMEHLASLLQQNSETEKTEMATLVCVALANGEIGTFQDVHAISALCHKHGARVHCDATQVVGRYRVDLSALDVDSATLSAHKFHGPKGVGALYVRRSPRVSSSSKPPLLNVCMTGGTQENGLRAGTENVPGVCAMVAALAECFSRLDAGQDAAVRALRDSVRRDLARRIPGVVFNGHPTDSLYNTLSVCLPVNSRELIPVLNQRRVYVNVGCACSKAAESTTLMAIGRTREQAAGSLRISFGFLNNISDAKSVSNAIVEAVERQTRPPDART